MAIKSFVKNINYLTIFLGFFRRLPGGNNDYN